MILQCEACNARFLLPDAAVPPEGRRVRCGKCKHEWHVASAQPQPVAAPAAPAPATPDIDALMREGKVEAPAPKKEESPVLKPIGRSAPVLPVAVPGWMMASAVAMMLLLIGFSLVLFKPEWLGYYPSTDLSVTEVTLRKGEKDAYVLSGRIVNKSDYVAPVPQLHIKLVDEKGVVVKEWTHTSRKYLLQPRQHVEFVMENLDTGGAAAKEFQLDLGNALELSLREM